MFSRTTNDAGTEWRNKTRAPIFRFQTCFKSFTCNNFVMSSRPADFPDKIWLYQNMLPISLIISQQHLSLSQRKSPTISLQSFSGPLGGTKSHIRCRMIPHQTRHRSLCSVFSVSLLCFTEKHESETECQFYMIIKVMIIVRILFLCNSPHPDRNTRSPEKRLEGVPIVLPSRR